MPALEDIDFAHLADAERVLLTMMDFGPAVERAAVFEGVLRQLIEDAGATPSASRGKASRFFEALAGRPI